jgi:peptidoglycan hydrolase-like protein with peptidoglycan-binding domain
MALVCGRLSGNADVVKASMNAPPMRQGSRGEGVKVLQLALIDLGTPMPRSTGGGASLPDGIFGSETHAAVVAFQRINGLVADGIAGAMTVARLDMTLATVGTLAARTAAVTGRKPKGMS